MASHRHIYLYAFLFVALLAFVIPTGHGYEPQTGDIIFHTSRSSQSLAIQQATGSPYSHMGMVVIRDKKPYVFEASRRVTYTPLDVWIARGVDGKFVAKRVKAGLSSDQQKRLQQTAERYVGKPYDLTFSWSDERQYCSEVVWKIYSNALGMNIGQLQKLGDFNLNSPAVKAKLKERYGDRIPLNETVISPQAMFDAGQLYTVAEK
ncbi:hypothetical protein SOASR030_02990 [Leminorella grimontii]|uniref:YiiX family permuted papain-like enzyme n=1 Tax=Leminorella grimontii TaxID=82981 RepID=A0AAV5MXK1_9GAMM|nr:YiiX family permuted papain-like enzyme [Leminorella grimontii]KFC95634.1 hypothetical protein GLGR_1796 [Leminorella grimontii ATCC 33999 = DSM 5078]GKX54187.1 hypothetical protein SOASR030_02990 [Leminorella grimontii]